MYIEEKVNGLNFATGHMFQLANPINHFSVVEARRMLHVVA
jgi:hypothetical protein